MKRVDAIYSHPLYIGKMAEIREAEKSRIYCRHDIVHALDVGRLMYIRFLEERAAESGCVTEEENCEHVCSPEKREHVCDSEKRSSVPITKELIYAAALLHDIGRADQYLYGTPHDEASARYADRILEECGFHAEERAVICSAIRKHRENEKQGAEYLSALLYEADKKSRLCMECAACDSCKWPDEKKNREINA